MTDSTAMQLLLGLQTQYNNHIANLINQRVKGVIINGEALEIKLGYSASSNLFFIGVSHIKTGLAISDSYSSYDAALTVYNNINSN
jgi:hypothetical protein